MLEMLVVGRYLVLRRLLDAQVRHIHDDAKNFADELAERLQLPESVSATARTDKLHDLVEAATWCPDVEGPWAPIPLRRAFQFISELEQCCNAAQALTPAQWLALDMLWLAAGSPSQA